MVHCLTVSETVQSHDQQTFDVTFDAEDERGSRVNAAAISVTGRATPLCPAPEVSMWLLDWRVLIVINRHCHSPRLVVRAVAFSLQRTVVFYQDKEGIDGETMVSKEGEEIAVKYLAMELNGMGVPPLDLEKPPEESEFEVDLAKKTGIDGMLRHLQARLHALRVLPLIEFPLPKASLRDMGDDLVDAVKEAEKTPNTLSAVSSYHREDTRRRGRAGQEEQERRGEERRGDTPGERTGEERMRRGEERRRARGGLDDIGSLRQCAAGSLRPCDHGQLPGYNDRDQHTPSSTLKQRLEHVLECNRRCAASGNLEGTVARDSAGTTSAWWTRLISLYVVTVVLYVDKEAPGSVAANRKRFVRQAVVHYDQDVGVYGVLFCVEGNFTYEIIDDFMGCRSKHSVMWAKSMQFDETWVSVLEKALAAGEMMCTGWYAPSKGKFANLEGGEGYWAKGIHLKTEEAGYYRSKDVELQIKSVMKRLSDEPTKLTVWQFTLDVEGVNDGEPLIWAMMVENQMMRREWKKRKVDGMNYKDKKQLGKVRATAAIRHDLLP
eukprot:Skav231238  [mRNA]  locus=scaffold1540:80180:93346:+ [translate_table: standard]